MLCIIVGRFKETDLHCFVVGVKPPMSGWRCFSPYIQVGARFGTAFDIKIA